MNQQQRKVISKCVNSLNGYIANDNQINSLYLKTIDSLISNLTSNEHNQNGLIRDLYYHSIQYPEIDPKISFDILTQLNGKISINLQNNVEINEPISSTDQITYVQLYRNENITQLSGLPYYQAYLNYRRGDGNNIIGKGQLLALLLFDGAIRHNNRHYDININDVLIDVKNSNCFKNLFDNIDKLQINNRSSNQIFSNKIYLVFNQYKPQCKIFYLIKNREGKNNE